MFSKFFNRKYLFILSLVLLIIVLFPPIYPFSYIFLFSSSYFKIRIEVLILELFVGALFSYLLFHILFISSRKFKLFLISIILSALIAILFFFVTTPFFSLFSPSFRSTEEVETNLYNKYSLLINNDDISAYVKISNYYTPTYLFSKYLNNYYEPNTYDIEASMAIYNSISLPSEILPPIDLFLYPVKESKVSNPPKKIEKKNPTSLFGDGDALSRLLQKIDDDSYNTLPSFYKTNNAIPKGFKLAASSLVDSLVKLKYSFVKSNYSELFSFFKAKENIYSSINDYYKFISILKYYILIIVFIICLIIFYIKRVIFLSHFNSFFIIA